MLEKLEGLADRYDELENQLASPNLYDDPERAAALTKEHRNLQPILKTYRAYQTACQDEQDAKELLEEAGGDADMHALAQETLASSREQKEQLEQELKILLLPKDARDERSVIMEIRAGAGGEEAALFAASLYRMYTMYADTRGWKTERSVNLRPNWAASERLPSALTAKAPFLVSSTRAVCTAYSACRRPNRRAVCTRLP